MANNTTKNQIATKNVVEKVLARVTAMQKNEGLVIPSDYSPANALNAAYLKLQEVKDKKGKPALTACTQASISMALLDMVIQGLSPSKNQCYFIPYGNQLTLMRSYMGTVAAAKRFGNIKDVFAQVVYEGDLFKYEITATEEGIVRREKIYGIVPSDTATLEERRFALRLRAADSREYTEKYLRQQLDNLVGADNYRMTINYEELSMQLLLSLGSKAKETEVKKLLSAVVPLHINLAFSLLYNTWEQVTNGKAWDELKAKTWNDWKENPL